MQIDTPITVRAEGNVVLMEPAPKSGIQGTLFTVHLTPERAREIGHQLIGAATMALRSTCNGGKSGR